MDERCGLDSTGSGQGLVAASCEHGYETLGHKMLGISPVREKLVTIARTVLEDICDRPIRIQSYCAVARLHGV
jgi:hypothetical protein